MIKVHGRGIVVGFPIIIGKDKSGDILVQYSKTKESLVKLKSDNFLIVKGISALVSKDIVEFSGYLEADNNDFNIVIIRIKKVLRKCV